MYLAVTVRNLRKLLYRSTQSTLRVLCADRVGVHTVTALHGLRTPGCELLERLRHFEGRLLLSRARRAHSGDGGAWVTLVDVGKHERRPEP